MILRIGFVCSMNSFPSSMLTHTMKVAAIWLNKQPERESETKGNLWIVCVCAKRNKGLGSSRVVVDSIDCKVLTVKEESVNWLIIWLLGLSHPVLNVLCQLCVYVALYYIHISFRFLWIWFDQRVSLALTLSLLFINFQLLIVNYIVCLQLLLLQLISLPVLSLALVLAYYNNNQTDHECVSQLIISLK